MVSVPPLQLQQLLLFWEAFSINLSISVARRSFDRVRHRCWARKPGSQSQFQFTPKVFDRIVWASQDLPNSTNHVFMDLALCTGA